VTPVKNEDGKLEYSREDLATMDHANRHGATATAATSQLQTTNMYHVPKSMRLAMLGRDKTEWIEATNKENFVILSRTELLNGARAIETKYLLARKSDRRYKARWVALGCQEADIPLSEKSSPTVNFISLRVIWSIAVTRGWQIKSSDYSSAYLCATLKVPLYGRLPSGYIDIVLSLDQQHGQRWTNSRRSGAIWMLKHCERSWSDHES
jgi:hypothetical protein